MSLLDDLTARLEGVRKQGKGLVAKCPAHNDNRPSLSVREGDDGRVLLFCHAGCTFKQVVAALGLKESDCMPPSGEQKRRIWATQKIEEVYDYEKADGTLAYQIVRKPGKDFRIRHKDAQGNWLYTKDGVELVPYRLPQVLRAIEHGEDVYLVEGEKDADTVEAQGECGTTIPFGVIKKPGDAGIREFRGTYGKWLRGAFLKVVGDLDRDGQGERYARCVCDAMTGTASAVTAFRAKTGKDTTDHVRAGYSLGQLERWKECEPALGLTVIVMSDVQEQPVGWLWEPYVPKRYGTLNDGDGDVGKSYMTEALMATLSNGFLPTGEQVEPVVSLFFASEDEAADTIKPRLRKLGADMSRIIVVPELFPLDGVGLAKVARLVGEYRPGLVSFDPLLGYVGAAVNINAANEVRPVLDGLRKIYSRYDAAGWHIRHERKPGKSKDGKAQPAEGHHEGLGSVDIRNAHRSQCVVRWHPELYGVRVVSHEKHNLSEQGDCFGFCFNAGLFEWVPYLDRPDEWGNKPKHGYHDPEGERAARWWLESLLLRGGASAVEVEAERKARGISAQIVRKVRRELRVVTQMRGREQFYVLPDGFDPFAEAQERVYRGSSDD